MVMNEGVATALYPISTCGRRRAVLGDGRAELGPEAYYADRIIDLVRAVKKIPQLISAWTNIIRRGRRSTSTTTSRYLLIEQGACGVMRSSPQAPRPRALQPSCSSPSYARSPPSLALRAGADPS
jgi:hypothetical protein